jgi:hypothetical protein
MNTTPPRWAEAWLRTILKPYDFDSVSGDLLEEYRGARDSGRGRGESNAWYIAQVFGFAWRSAWSWAALMGAAFVVRTAMDWLVPTSDFHGRSLVSTLLGIGLLLAVGFRASWRSRSFLAGAVGGVVVSTIGAAISVAGAGVLFVFWHDPHTMALIAASGGLGEVFTMPVMLILPGLIVGAIGGAAGASIRRLVAA